MKKVILKEENFNVLSEDVCQYDNYEPGRISLADCKRLKPQFSSNTKKAIRFAATSNIPLLPRINSKEDREVVLGTSRYLLPYYVCDDLFMTFTVPDEMWNLKLNMQFLDCVLAGAFSDTDIIRLVTTKRDLKNDQGGLRVTAKEICYIKHKYGLKFYKLLDQEYKNIFFLCFKKPSSKCKMISGNEIEYK